MNKFVLTFSFLFISLFVLAQENLELKKIVQLNEKRYELSGFALHPTLGVVCIQDEKDEVSVIDTVHWKLKKLYSTSIQNSDFEGIEVCDSSIFVLNERDSKVYQVTAHSKKPIKVNYKTWEAENKVDLQIKRWRNAGYEGVAIDCKGGKLYLAKERKARGVDDGRFVFEVDIKTGEILRKIEIKAIAPNPDFADAKFEENNGVPFLYLLERNSYSIVRYNLKTGEIKRCHFDKIAANKDKKQDLYQSEHPEYGITEALLLTQNQIWIGVDNNQMEVNKKNKWVKKYKLKGDAPAILIFKRPTDF